MTKTWTSVQFQQIVPHDVKSIAGPTTILQAEDKTGSKQVILHRKNIVQTSQSPAPVITFLFRVSVKSKKGPGNKRSHNRWNGQARTSLRCLFSNQNRQHPGTSRQSSKDGEGYKVHSLNRLQDKEPTSVFTRLRQMSESILFSRWILWILGQ